MTHNLNSTVFVYRNRETGAIKALYTEGARAMTGRDDYEHVASLEPRMWIEHHFDDAAKERQPLTDERLKVKIGGWFGADLSGHWFYLTPADEHAEAALAKHTGIGGDE